MKLLKSFTPIKMIVVILAGHLLITLFIVFFPSPIGSNRYIDIYRRYLLPGPFFSEQTTKQSSLLELSLKNGEGWQSANPTLKHFSSFFSTGNPSKLYKTRLERSIYETWLIASKSDHPLKLNFDMRDMVNYYIDNHDLPKDYDSVKMIFLRKNTRDFKVTIDTLQILDF